MGSAQTARDTEFAAFTAGAYSSLLRTARLLTGDWHTAEDLVQAALIRVYLRWHRSGEWESRHAYARRVMVRLYSTWRRRRWHSETPQGEPADPGADVDPADRVAGLGDLRRALAALPREQRVVVVLRFYEDLSVEQTADLLECSQGTVKSRTSRALARLRSSRALDTYEGRWQQ